MRLSATFLAAFIGAAMFAVPAAAQDSTSEQDAQTLQSLRKGFTNPPSEARPRTWWHWMNGNITKDGIRKDLEWMHDAGIVGVHVFDAGLETPQVVKERLAYMTPEWNDAFIYAMKKADSLGMEVTIPSSPGWSETGGPWVKPEDGMKKLVWRTVDVTSGPVSITLPEGFSQTGKFQDEDLSQNGVSDVKVKLRFYKDIAVLAVKLNDKDIDLGGLNPVLTFSGLKEQASQDALLSCLTNDSISDLVYLEKDGSGGCWAQYDFGEPVTVKTLEASSSDGPFTGYARKLLSSNDGKTFSEVLTLPYQASAQGTYTFAPVTARYFRWVTEAPEIGLGTFRLSTVARVNGAGDKGAFAHYRYAGSVFTPLDAEPAQEVIDVTEHVKDGVLNWTVPEGRWRIFRYGYGLTGKLNHPASPEATGLEVDKMDPDAIREYYTDYLALYEKAVGGKLTENGISYILNDSYEAGPQTWTGRMVEEFKARRGYDLLPWMPVLSGIVVGSAAESDRFLFDWRRTLGELVSEYHYDMLNEILDSYGLSRYTESHEAWRANMSDGMDCKRYAQIPMSAFWMSYNQGDDWGPRFDADVRESASVAHIYGQNIAAAESFTTDGFRDGAIVFTPDILKKTADMALAAGLNRFVFHTSVHQPVDSLKPGLGLDKYGQWFTRHETWSGQARAWTDYLSRSCFMLQQGRFVADVAFYYGEDTNATGVFMTKVPDFPSGYSYDYVSPSVLRDVLRPEGGKLVTATGMSYSALYLKNVGCMSMEMLLRIKELADNGITICGDRPGRIMGLQGTEEEFKALVADIWDSGRENVSAGVPIDRVLMRKGIQKDVSTSRESDAFKYVHRTMPGTDIYFITNRSGEALATEMSFRSKHRKAQIWRAETGAVTDLEAIQGSGRTTVSLNMPAYDALFVVLSDDAVESEEVSGFTPVISEMPDKETVSVAGPWTIRFAEGRGAPESTTVETLSSLTESSVSGIKYFSGEAEYSNTFKLKKKQLSGRICIDLGQVGSLAEVTVNGKNLGVAWHAPYVMDITDAVKTGSNSLKVKVVNAWNNRMIGDVQAAPEEKVTYYPVALYTAESPLLPSGLLGPVRIVVR